MHSQTYQADGLEEQLQERSCDDRVVPDHAHEKDHACSRAASFDTQSTPQSRPAPPPWAQQLHRTAPPPWAQQLLLNPIHRLRSCSHQLQAASLSSTSTRPTRPPSSPITPCHHRLLLPRRHRGPCPPAQTFTNQTHGKSESQHQRQ